MCPKGTPPNDPSFEMTVRIISPLRMLSGEVKSSRNQGSLQIDFLY